MNIFRLLENWFYDKSLHRLNLNFTSNIIYILILTILECSRNCNFHIKVKLLDLYSRHKATFSDFIELTIFPDDADVHMAPLLDFCILRVVWVA